MIPALGLIYGIELSIAWSRRVTRPSARLKEAAVTVETGDPDPEILTDVVRRRDELGKLAVTSTKMAQEVKAMRIEIVVAKTTRQVEEITDTGYFSQFQERVKECHQ
jgi:HAMP domain-containing protein